MSYAVVSHQGATKMFGMKLGKSSYSLTSETSSVWFRCVTPPHLPPWFYLSHHPLQSLGRTLIKTVTMRINFSSAAFLSPPEFVLSPFAHHAVA